MEIRIVLNEQDFENLVAGKEVVKCHLTGLSRWRRLLNRCDFSVRMILSDIGFDRIERAVKQARDSK